MRPLIGVTPLWRTEKEHLWMRLEYLEGVMEAGGAPVVFPFTEDEELVAQLTQMCDGILFTGGHDISPSIYGEEPLPQLEDVSEQRDRLELLVLKKAMELHKPIFGICRGIQFLNAALGGTLYQDIPTQYDTEIAHHQSEPYPVPTHQVNIVPGSPLAGLLGNDPIMVNSFHHQAVKDLAPGLTGFWKRSTVPVPSTSGQSSGTPRCSLRTTRTARYCSGHSLMPARMNKQR